MRPRTRARLSCALAVLAIAVLAAGVRAWRIQWGLDDLGFPDEAMFWGERGQRFVPLTWSSFETRKLTYPTLYLYLTGLGTAAAHACELIRPTPPTVESVILTGRIVSAVVGTITVGLVGLLGTALYSRRAGLCAATLMAVLPLEAMQTHYASVDVLLSMLGALALLLSWRLARYGSCGVAALAGVVTGLAFGTKYVGVLFLSAPAWASFEVARRERSVTRFVTLATATVIGFAVGIRVACPPCVDRYDVTVGIIRGLASLDPRAGFTGNHVPAPGLGWYGHAVRYQLVASLPYALGWPLYAVALVGVATAMRRRALADRVVLVPLLATFACLASIGVTYPRYLLPVLPSLAVLAGRQAAGAGRWSVARAGTFAAVAAYSLALTLSQVARFSYAQQHDVADWLRTTLAGRVAPGKRPRIAVPDTLDFYNGLGRPLGRTGFVVEARPTAQWLTSAPDAFVLPHFVANSIRRDEDPAGPVVQSLARLEGGAEGYDAQRVWRARYLDDWLYTWLDPVFEADLWQGSIGFTVYLPRSPQPPATP